MKTLLPRLFCAALVCLLFVDGRSLAQAAGCDDTGCSGLLDPETEECTPCGQPLLDGFGDTPLTSDALAILRAAVGQEVDGCSGERFCLCDVDCSGSVTTADALRVLRAAVGLQVDLHCCCAVSADCLPCTSAEIFTRPGSDLDYGWTGLAHDSDPTLGASITMRVKRECSVTTDQECERDEDCPESETCEPTCDCVNDVTCEVTGPTHQRKCRNNLTDCDTNADCQASIPCVHTLGPPMPLASGGTPVCVVNVFNEPISGTANSDTGEGEFRTALLSRVLLGITLDKPCPRCGALNENPRVGDTFTCSGGQFNGAACTVEGVSDEFGGTSSDCPPELSSGVSGNALTIRVQQTTTGTTTKTAKLQCKSAGLFSGNPTIPGSNPKCIDKLAPGDPLCTSNADCKRCTEDLTTSCASNIDCTGKGSCAEAPEQPISCGFWCHCGFCDNDPTLPCFETSDCPNGQTCVAGTGAQNTTNMGQQRPNDCSDDGFVCGGGGVEEECATTQKSTCSDEPYRTCDANEDCEAFNAGFCNIEPRPCFESRITRSGVPSPLGTYCAFESKECTTNTDCTGEGDYCAPDSSRPETVGLFCVPATNSGPVNTASGITGPAAVRHDSFIQVCRCGDGIIGCDEDCDDENVFPGDGCDELCQEEAVP
jgi:hypothetical protein